MNLTSCDHCGVVLDKDKLRFCEDIYREDDSVNTAYAAWDGERYVPFVVCPVCKHEILNSTR